jgi:hypothetical protein
MICCARSRSAAGIRSFSEGMAEMVATAPDTPTDARRTAGAAAATEHDAYGR